MITEKARLCISAAIHSVYVARRLYLQVCPSGSHSHLKCFLKAQEVYRTNLKSQEKHLNSLCHHIPFTATQELKPLEAHRKGIRATNPFPFLLNSYQCMPHLDFSHAGSVSCMVFTTHLYTGKVPFFLNLIMEICVFQLKEFNRKDYDTPEMAKIQNCQHGGKQQRFSNFPLERIKRVSSLYRIYEQFLREDETYSCEL